MRSFLALAVVVIVVVSVATFASAFSEQNSALLRRMKQQRNGPIVVQPKPGTSRLFVSYCPTDFTNRLAVVDVATATGKYEVIGTTTMPSGVFGCSADYSPTYSFDPSRPNEVIFDFTSDAGYFVFVTIDEASKTVTAAAFNSKSLFFSGFLSFQVDGSSATAPFVGITGMATQSGYCSDACIGFGHQNTTAADREKSTPLPWRAISDDTSFLDRSNQLFYAQASHPLQQGCAPEAWEDCMLAIEAKSGQVLATHYNKNAHVYRFGVAEVPDRRSSSSSSAAASGPIVMAFVVGMNQRCNRSESESSYAFAEVNLATSNFTKVSCASTSVTIHTGPWISSFSTSSRHFVTASGSDGEDPQFLSYDVASGAVLVNSKLTGLAKELKAAMGLIFVWAVQAF